MPCHPATRLPCFSRTVTSHHDFLPHLGHLPQRTLHGRVVRRFTLRTLLRRNSGRSAVLPNNLSSQNVAETNFFVTRLSLNNEWIWTLVCRECTLRRDNPDSKFVCALFGNVRSGPVLVKKTTNSAGSLPVEILVPSKKSFHSCTWVLISSGFKQHASQRDSIWSNSLPREAVRDSSRDKDSPNQERPCTSNEQKGPKDVQRQGDLVYTSPKYQKPSDQRKQIRTSPYQKKAKRWDLEK